MTVKNKKNPVSIVYEILAYPNEEQRKQTDTFFPNFLFSRGAVEFLGFGVFFMPLYILHIMQSKFIKNL